MKNNISGNTALPKNLGTYASYDGDNIWSKVNFLKIKQPSLPGINAHFGRNVSLRHHGKLAVSKTSTLMVNESHRMTNTTSEIQKMVQALADENNSATKYLRLGNSSLISLGGMIEEATHVKNITDSRLIPKIPTDKRPAFFGEAAEVGNGSWPLHQQSSSLEAALEKQKALATNVWSARCLQQPARHFTYHRVTSSPQVQRPRQHSAFVVVSVATVPEVRGTGATAPSPLVALPDKVDQLLHERRDPLEQQLADLSPHRDMPGSHTRHLNSMQVLHTCTRMVSLHWCAEDHNFITQVLFTDQITFTREEPLNSHNRHSWPDGNPSTMLWEHGLELSVTK
ncbi:hypothetical protein PR048_000784 [Dryococelus australis]|uniref:Uncharacterized protein n=1 Tax=Dryococelus australis TaxID=614101 RepID=A0ABQ9IFL5_9NEOP|nr:hypothetical protein PR048_000784 [Dryococelus australis]